MTTPIELYASIPAVNFSTLKAMAISPLRYHHILSTPRKDTDPMRVGRLQHCAVLQPELAELWPHWDGKDRKGPAWLAFQAQHGGDYHRAQEMQTARTMSAAVRAHPSAGPLLRGGVAETPVMNTCPRTGIRRKCRPDYRRPGHVVELKTTGLSLSKRMIQKQIAGLLYHAQAAFYLDCCEADIFTWIFVEQAAPHDVVVVPANTQMIEEGRRLYSGWLDLLVQCQAESRWPGLSDEPMDIELPDYAIGCTDDPGLDMTGLEAA